MEAAERLAAAAAEHDASTGRLSAAPADHDVTLDGMDDRQSNSAPPTSRRYKECSGADEDDEHPDARAAAALHALREKAQEQDRLLADLREKAQEQDRLLAGLRSSLAAESQCLSESRQSEAHLRLHLSQAHAATTAASEAAAKQSAAWSSKLSALLQTLRAREAAETAEREAEREKQLREWDAERSAIQAQLAAAQDAARKSEAARLAASEAHAAQLLAASEAHAAQLRSAGETHAAQLQSLRSENAAQASAHSSQLAQVHSHIQSVQGDLAISGAQVAALHAELERSRTAIAAMEHEKQLRVAAEADKRDLQMALETVRADLAQLQVATRQERAALDQLTHREQQKQQVALEAAHAELDRWKLASQQEQQRLTEQLGAAKADLVALQQRSQEERQQLQRSNQMDQQWFREQLAEAQARANIAQQQMQQQQTLQLQPQPSQTQAPAPLQSQLSQTLAPQLQFSQARASIPLPQQQPQPPLVEPSAPLSAQQPQPAQASAPLSPLLPRSQPHSAPMSPLQPQPQPSLVQPQQYSLPASPPHPPAAQAEPRQQQQPSPTLQEDPLAQLGQRRASATSAERPSVSFADASAPAHAEAASAGAASAAAAPLAVAAASIPASAVPSSSSALSSSADLPPSVHTGPPPSAYVLAAQKRASFAVQEFELSIADIISELPLDANANNNAAAAPVAPAASASAAAAAGVSAAPAAAISPHLLSAPHAQPSVQNRRISMKILEASVVSNDEVAVDRVSAHGGRSSKSPKPQHKKAQTRQLSKSSIPGVSELAAESAQLAQQQRGEDTLAPQQQHGVYSHAEEDDGEMHVELVGEDEEPQLQLEVVDESESKEMEQSVTVHRVSPRVTVHTDPSDGVALPAATSAFIPLALFQRLHLKYVGLASTHAALAEVQQRNALDLEATEARLAEIQQLLHEERDRTEAARQTRLDSPALIPIDQECPHCLENALLLDETREASEAKTAEINAVYGELLAIKDAQIAESQAELNQLREEFSMHAAKDAQIAESQAELQQLREEVSARTATEEDLKAALADVEAQGSLSDNALRSGLKLALRNLSDLRAAHASLRGQLQQLQAAHAESVEGILHRMSLRGGPESPYDMLSLSAGSSLSSSAAAATAAANLWAHRFKQEQRARREACSALQQARGNLRVIARIRPSLPSDQSARAAFASEDDKQLLALVSPPQTEENDEADGDAPAASASETAASTRNFEFDRVYASSSSTADLYASELASMASSLFAPQSSHSLVMALGGPGSGKSRSMYGEKPLWDVAKATMVPTTDPGIAQRLFSDVFRTAAERSVSATTKVSLTIFAIGQERITDLLAVEAPRVGSSPPPATVIKIRERPTDGGSSAAKELLFEPALTEVVCATVDDALSALKKADKARAVHATRMGERVSSRHFIVQLKVESTKFAATSSSPLPASPTKAKGAVTSTLSLVEFLTRYPSQVPPPSDPGAARAMRAKDARAGNPALTSLARVFGAIASGAAFVPWRDSMLTRVLQACFERPRSKALCIVHVAPSLKDASDSLEYLRLGIKARRVIGATAAPPASKRKLVAAGDGAMATTMESTTLSALSADPAVATLEPADDLFEQPVVDSAFAAAAAFEDDDAAAESFAATLGSTASFERMMALAKKADEEESAMTASTTSSARPASSPPRSGLSAPIGGAGSSSSKKQGKLPGVALKDLQSKLDEALAREEALRKALAVEKGNNALMKAQRRSKSGSTTPALSANAKDGPATPLSASALKDAGLGAPDSSPSSSSSKRTPSHSRQGSDSGSVAGSAMSGTASARAALVSPPRSTKRSSSTSGALLSPSDRFALSSSASATALSAAASGPTAEEKLKAARDDISTLKDLIASLETRLLQKSRMEEDLRSERARFAEKEKEWLVKESRFQEKELRRSRLEAAARAGWERERRTLEAIIAGDPTARAERDMDANLFVNTLAEQPRDVRNPESVCVTRLIGDVRELQHHLRVQKQLAANTERFLEAQGLPSMETLWTDRVALAPQFTSVKHYSSSSAASSSAAAAPVSALSSPSSDSHAGHQRGYSSPPRIRGSEERTVSFEDELPLLKPGSRTPSPQRRADLTSPPPPSAMTPSHAKAASTSSSTLPSSLKPAIVTPAAPTFVIQTTPIVMQRKPRPAVVVEESAASVTALGELASEAPTVGSTVAASSSPSLALSSASSGALADATGPGSPTSANISRGLEMASMILSNAQQQHHSQLANGINGVGEEHEHGARLSAAKFINEAAVAAALAELKSSEAIDHVILSVVPASASDLANCPGGCLSTRKVVVLSQGSGVLSEAWVAQHHLDPELSLFVVMRLAFPASVGSEERVPWFVVVEWIGPESHLASSSIVPASASFASAAADPAEFAPLMQSFIAAHLPVSLTSQASHPSQVTMLQISSDLSEVLQSRGRHHASASSSSSAARASSAARPDDDDGNESDSSTGSFVDLNAQLAEEQQQQNLKQQQQHIAFAIPDASASSPAAPAASSSSSALDSSFTAADVITAESLEADLAAASRARAAAASLTNHAAAASSGGSSYGAALAAVSQSTPSKIGGVGGGASGILVSAASTGAPLPSGLRPRKPVTPWLSTAARQARAASESAAAATLEATYTAASFSQTAPASTLAAAMRMPVKSALKGSSSAAAAAATLAPRTPSPAIAPNAEEQPHPQAHPQPAHHKKSVSFVEGDIETENLNEY